MIGNAPRNEDSAIHSWRDNPAEATIVGVAPIISRHTATPRLAPELMPNTEGSASGLLNNVCNKRPETDNAAPVSSAVSVIFNLEEIMICFNSDSSAFPERNCNISPIEIPTLPIKILTTTAANRAIIETDPIIQYALLCLLSI